MILVKWPMSLTSSAKNIQEIFLGNIKGWEYGLGKTFSYQCTERLGLQYLTAFNNFTFLCNIKATHSHIKVCVAAFGPGGAFIVQRWCLCVVDDMFLIIHYFVVYRRKVQHFVQVFRYRWVEFTYIECYECTFMFVIYIVKAVCHFVCVFPMVEFCWVNDLCC